MDCAHYPNTVVALGSHEKWESPETSGGVKQRVTPMSHENILGNYTASQITFTEEH